MALTATACLSRTRRLRRGGCAKGAGNNLRIGWPGFCFVLAPASLLRDGIFAHPDIFVAVCRNKVRTAALVSAGAALRFPIDRCLSLIAQGGGPVHVICGAVASRPEGVLARKRGIAPVRVGTLTEACRLSASDRSCALPTCFFADHLMHPFNDPGGAGMVFQFGGGF